MLWIADRSAPRKQKIDTSELKNLVEERAELQSTGWNQRFYQVLPYFSAFVIVCHRNRDLGIVCSWLRNELLQQESVCVCALSRGGTRSRSGFWVINKFLSVLKDFGILWQHIDGFRKVLCELVTDVITGLDPAVKTPKLMFDVSYPWNHARVQNRPCQVDTEKGFAVVEPRLRMVELSHFLLSSEAQIYPVAIFDARKVTEWNISVPGSVDGLFRNFDM
jgi:hypothetical protein